MHLVIHLQFVQETYLKTYEDNGNCTTPCSLTTFLNHYLMLWVTMTLPMTYLKRIMDQQVIIFKLD